MSVVCATSHGWLLDSCALIDEALQRCVCYSAGREEPAYFTCSFRREYFDIIKPHGQNQPNIDNMTSGVDTANQGNDGESTQVDLKTRKKRKRKHRDLNTGEIDANIYHNKIRSVVLEGSQALLEVGRQCGFLTEASSTSPSKSVPPHECRLAALCDVAKQLPLTEACPVQTLSRDGLDPALDLFSCVTENPLDCALEVPLMREAYLLPPRCRFLLSDITRMHPLVNSGDKYDLIVLDPPWENKSVKRSNRYSSLPSSQLKQLPVPALAAPVCLVVTWVTNRAKHLRFVREELYPHWRVEVLAEWLWVKVTRSGEFVFPLDSQHKKPYEVLVLGRFRSSGEHTVRSSVVDDLPEQRLLLSVPSVLHSHKPSLSAVLKPYVRHEPRCLELFARGLQADWSSWGNEVLKLQHISYFTRGTPENSLKNSSRETQGPEHTLKYTQDTENSLKHTQDPENSLKHPSRERQDPEHTLKHTQDPENSLKHPSRERQDPEHTLKHTQDPENSLKHPSRETQDPEHTLKHTQDPENSLKHPSRETQDPEHTLKHTQDPKNSLKHPSRETQGPEHTLKHTQDPENNLKHFSRDTQDPEHTLKHTQDPENNLKHFSRDTQDPEHTLKHTQHPENSLKPPAERNKAPNTS